MDHLLKDNVFPYETFYSRRTLLTHTECHSLPHDHDFYEFFIVEEGVVLHHINGQTEALSPDTLVLIHPEDQHAFSCEERMTAKFYNLSFGREEYEKAWKVAQACAAINPDTPMTTTMPLPHELSRVLLRRMKWLQDVNRQTPISVQYTEGITLIADILVLCAEGSSAAYTIPYWLRKACSSMYKPKNLPQGISRMVEVSGKTQEHLTRSMRKYFGQTPSNFVNTIRLERTAKLLTTTTRPIQDIMLEVGFQNTSYFNKLFKEQYHVSPRQYRANARTLPDKTEYP